MSEGVQILIVEDDTAVLETLQTGVEDLLGARVVTAASGRDGEYLLRNHRPSAAIIDVMLPDISGFDLAAIGAGLDIPVLLISGHNVAETVCLRHKFPCMIKPFPLSRLVQATEVLLGRTDEIINQTKTAIAQLRAT